MTTAVREQTWRQVRWTGLFGLTVRQHRATILVTTALVLVGVALLLWLAGEVVRGRPLVELPVVGEVSGYGPGVLTMLDGYAGFIAAIWAAPLVSREYETGTFALAWGQDVRPGRWLAGKALTLGTLAVLLAVALGAAARYLSYRSEQLSDALYPRYFEAFESHPLMQAGYTLFGFALGVAASVLTRRTVVAIVVAMVGFAAVRIGVGTWRSYFLPPVREVIPLGQGPVVIHGPVTELRVGPGFLDGAGNWVTQYQPLERLETFRLIEFGIFAVLAAALFAIAGRVLGRSVRP